MLGYLRLLLGDVEGRLDQGQYGVQVVHLLEVVLRLVLGLLLVGLRHGRVHVVVTVWRWVGGSKAGRAVAIEVMLAVSVGSELGLARIGTVHVADVAEHALLVGDGDGGRVRVNRAADDRLEATELHGRDAAWVDDGFGPRRSSRRCQRRLGRGRGRHGRRRFVDDARPLRGQPHEHARLGVVARVHAVLEVRRRRDLRTLLALHERHHIRGREVSMVSIYLG